MAPMNCLLIAFVDRLDRSMRPLNRHAPCFEKVAFSFIPYKYPLFSITKPNQTYTKKTILWDFVVVASLAFPPRSSHSAGRLRPFSQFKSQNLPTPKPLLHHHTHTHCPSAPTLTPPSTAPPPPPPPPPALATTQTTPRSPPPAAGPATTHSQRRHGPRRPQGPRRARRHRRGGPGSCARSPRRRGCGGGRWRPVCLVVVVG